jgi:hypothetical protein
MGWQEPRGAGVGDGKQEPVRAPSFSGPRFSQRFHGVPVRIADGTKAYPGAGQTLTALAAKRQGR